MQAPESSESTLSPFEKHITVANSEHSPVELLETATGFSRQSIKSIMQKGAVWITRDGHTAVLRRAKRKLSAGDELHLYFNQQVLDEKPVPATLVLDAGSYSVWDKPFGMLSRGSRWGDHCTIVRWAEATLEPQRSAFIVHRLDKAATGIILLAHSKKSAQYFSNLFAERKIEKHYKVVVSGKFAEPGEKTTLQDDIEDKQAISHVEMLSYDEASDESKLDVQIETGRKHQIRKQLQLAGHPVIGDRLYGTALSDRDLQLRAISLSFHCPEQDETRTILLDDDNAVPPVKLGVSSAAQTISLTPMITLDSLPVLLSEKADEILFQDIIELIDSLYDFTETAFRNGDLENHAGENNGSCKVLAFAQLQTLSSQKTLACFGQFYQEVLADAEGNGHQNIRNFMNSGWDGVEFESAPLKAK